MTTYYSKTRRATYNLTVHLVFVTKYRRKVLNSQYLKVLHEVFVSVMEKWDGQVIEFNGETDHIHLLIHYPPHKLLSSIISNLKSTSSKALWSAYPNELIKVYWSKKVLWTGSYFVASCGGVTIERLKEYVQSQDSPD